MNVNSGARENEMRRCKCTVLCGYNDGCNGVNEGYYTENDKNVEKYFQKGANAHCCMLTNAVAELTIKDSYNDSEVSP